MYRIRGAVLLAVGVFCVVLAVLLPAFCLPLVQRVPDNPEVEVSARGTDVTVMVASLAVRGENPLLTGQTVVATRRIVGTTAPDPAQLPPSGVFWRTAADVRVVNSRLRGDEGLVTAYVEGSALDASTGRSLPCCGEYIVRTEGGTPESLRHEGYVFKFPFGVRRDRAYPYWDVQVGAAVPARYAGDDEVNGVATYRFLQVIGDTPTVRQEVPGAYFNVDRPSVVAQRVYATTRTLWVEPATGAILKLEEFQNQRLRYGGLEIPIFRGRMELDPASVAKNVEVFGPAATGLVLLGRTGPRLLGLLGAASLVAALVALRRDGSRRRPRGTRAAGSGDPPARSGDLPLGAPSHDHAISGPA